MYLQRRRLSPRNTSRDDFCRAECSAWIIRACREPVESADLLIIFAERMAMRRYQPQLQRVPVSTVHYTQDSISCTFRHGPHHGRSLSSLVDDLQSEKIPVEHGNLVLDVVEWEGRRRCLNNRRLWCLKEYARRLDLDIDIQVRLSAGCFDCFCRYPSDPH